MLHITGGGFLSKPN